MVLRAVSTATRPRLLTPAMLAEGVAMMKTANVGRRVTLTLSASKAGNSLERAGLRRCHPPVGEAGSIWGLAPHTHQQEHALRRRRVHLLPVSPRSSNARRAVRSGSARDLYRGALEAQFARRNH